MTIAELQGRISKNKTGNNKIWYSSHMKAEIPKITCVAYFYMLGNTTCRKYLDIRKKGFDKSLMPQLLIIMLNPGSSKNNDQWGKEIEVESDATVNRVKLLIKSGRFSYIRIINLSDIREKDSNKFFNIVKEEEHSGSTIHSIFHPSRRGELSKSIGANTQILFAWGTNKKNKELANHALTYFREPDFIILNKDEKYYHPLMRPSKNGDAAKSRKKWLDIVSELL